MFGQKIERTNKVVGGINVEGGGTNKVVGGINVEGGGIKLLISNIKHIKAATKLELVNITIPSSCYNSCCSSLME